MILLFQSTLPREERHGGVLSALQPYIFQSTLPREERRDLLTVQVVDLDISIHAPTRGATDLADHFVAVMVISIHAPTRGATRQLTQATTPRQYFNPRSHERSDQSKDCHPGRNDISIHAPTRGATGLHREPFLGWHISIHAPTRGATMLQDYQDKYMEISIHAPTRGATFPLTKCRSGNRFQSTLPREERQQYCTKNLFIFIQYRQ